MKTRTELKELAKEVLMEAVSAAYYKVSDGDWYDLTEEEQETVILLIRKYGIAMGKAIGKRYYSS